MNRVPGDQLSALRAQYRQSMLDKAEVIARLLASVQRDAPQVEVIHDAHMRAHSLHGTAGSYGFHAVGEAAGKLEVALGPLLENGQHPDAWMRTDQACAELIAQVKHAAASQGD